MIPILFSGDAAAFNSNGKGLLSDCISCEVEETRNGIYELNMVYPVDGIHYEEIEWGDIILAQAQDGKDPQAFFVQDVQPTMSGKAEIFGEHISYILNWVASAPFTAETVNEAMLNMKPSLYSGGEDTNRRYERFDYWTDKSTTAHFEHDTLMPARSVLAGTRGSILDVYGGEYEFDNFHVKLWQNRGSDKGVVIRYETYGKLSPEADNAVLVEHALSGDAHLAGYHSPEDRKPGWWDDMVGPGKPFDTNKLFIVCSNIIGGCSGSTGPRSIDPDTGRRYDMDFPIITIADMVRAQERLMRHLGIKKWFCVAGGSMGGMLALQWGVSYPEAVNGTIAIATTARVSSQGISFNWVSREAIMNDQHWLDGNYEEQPQRGLATARMLAHITYLSDESMNHKFGRALQESPASNYEFAFSKDFRIESYLAHQGSKFVERFDANSYLYITRAIDYFDLSDCADGNLAGALKRVETPFLIVSFSSDWLFPAYQSKELVRALLDNGNDVTYCNIQSSYGHDAFLLETESLGSLISSYLTNLPWEPPE